MNRLCKVIILTVLSVCITAPEVLSADWENFNKSWKFTKGNPENAKAVNFDDSSWENVSIPHDWAITGPFDPDGNAYRCKKLRMTGRI